MIVFLPILVLAFAYGCNQEAGYQPFHALYNFFTQFKLNNVTDTIKSWNYGGALVYLAIVVQLAVYSIALPGEEVQGERLRDGSRLSYKINALTVFQGLVTMGFMALRGQGYYLFVWTKAHFSDIALFALVFSFVVSGAVYVASFFGNKMLALGGNTGNPIYDVSCLFINTLL